MIVFHCHHLLSDNSLSSLVGLLQSVKDEVIIVLREDGVNNFKQQNFTEKLSTLAQLAVLSSDLESPFSNTDIDSIDDSKFVQLCSDAEKIIAWK